jgi:hypothetical protein
MSTADYTISFSHHVLHRTSIHGCGVGIEVQITAYFETELKILGSIGELVPLTGIIYICT